MIRAIERFASILDEYPDAVSEPMQRQAFAVRIGEEYGVDPREPAVSGIYRILDGIRRDYDEEGVGVAHGGAAR